MDNDELMRYRGEQVTMEKEWAVVRSEIETERLALQGFTNELGSQQRNLARDWLESQIARLRRIAELLQREQDVGEKIQHLKQFTDI